MIKLYTSPSCSSCRKVKKYFEKYNIEYEEKNIFTTPISKEDIFKMLVRSENGFEDIISTRSKIFKEMGISLYNMSTHNLIEFIVNNPSVLKRPIIVTDAEIQVGYNDDDIELFLPQEIREMDCGYCFKSHSPGEECDYVKNIKFTK
ncbi:MAG: Spx/MgsR family RNA polymerase-binding regulatory protein [Bacilli bacterium]|nr:Spx/MgsR family RNA polymerase-binding regulatory protein [Bacilli bacterium]MDD4388445.1 Spx/MgsR family RNA polymerase-binding regulatory protein [Bacilli bacterium]